MDEHHSLLRNQLDTQVNQKKALENAQKAEDALFA
jgi:hypothetical protein